MRVADSELAESNAPFCTSGKAVTVMQLLRQGAGFLSRIGVESARLDAELLLGKALKCAREEIYCYPEARVDPETKELFDRLIARRARGEPLAYIVEEREFWSLAFRVTPEVLIPRPETEVLVEVALELARKWVKRSPIKILDLGTGSGAIAVALAKEIGSAEIWATDLSIPALGIARDNAVRHQVDHRIRFCQGDLFTPLTNGARSFDLIVSNPPYLREKELADLPAEIRDWEPRTALDGGVDGLAFYRRIAREAHRYLAAGGFLALEIGADMALDVAGLLAGAGCYSTPVLRRDYAGRDRVLFVQKALHDAPCRQSSQQPLRSAI